MLNKRESTILSFCLLAACLVAAGVATGPAGTRDDAAYREEIRKWREQREARLKADGGWLTVAGLFWLKEGSNRFGADAANEIVLPEGSAPPLGGVFEFLAGKTTVQVEPGVTVTAGGAPVTRMELKPDTTGAPDVLTLGALTMHVIQRGDRFAIRLKDMNSRFRREFTGLKWFPVDPAYRVTARFEPYDPPKQIAVPNILGTTERMPSPGGLIFNVGRRELRLDAVLEEPNAKELFIIFRDETSGKETYPAGRFLYTSLPAKREVVLDFNKAYSPPCAFTPYATCPLPPEQNRLSARIEAGELTYGHH